MTGLCILWHVCIVRYSYDPQGQTQQSHGIVLIDLLLLFIIKTHPFHRIDRLPDETSSQLVVEGRIRAKEHVIQAHNLPGAREGGSIPVDRRVVEDAAEVDQGVLF